MNTLTRLQVGMVVQVGEFRYRVEMVNESRAHLVPLDLKTRRFKAETKRNAGKLRVFQERMPGINVSPNSECDILEWSCRTGTTTNNTDKEAA